MMTPPRCPSCDSRRTKTVGVFLKKHTCKCKSCGQIFFLEYVRGGALITKVGGPER